MIFTRTRNKAAKARDQVGAEEAHRMWRIVKHRYLIIDHTNTLVNFIHDLEFKLILNAWFRIGRRTLKSWKMN